MSAAVPRLAAALADRYRIERELGHGGMATVYLAHDLKHDRQVAVKVLRPELAAVIGAERFLAEIRTTANLQHPHILPLFDSGAVDGTVFYVMPFVEGESLRDRLSREKQLPIADAVRIASEVAGALDYAHRHRVIHRDIKPENILLHDGRALVADFGIALAATSADSRMTETGMSLGTPHYMSPEQAMGAPNLDARTDVYALGCVLHEMLTGEPPFTGPTAQAIVAKVMTADPEPVSTYRKTVPAHVEDAVTTALAKLPADRFAGAADLAAALGNAAFATPGTGRRAAIGVSGTGVSRRAFAGVAILAAVLLVAAAIGWLRPHPAAETSRQRVVLWEQGLPPLLAPGTRFIATQAAIAPDGSSIVFVDPLGGQRLFRKLRHEGDPSPLTGTEGALSPFFSPDGAWVGYITTDGRLRKVPIGGGGSVTLADDANFVYPSGAWLEDQTILYISGRGRGLLRIPAAGGPGTEVPIGGTDAALNLAALWPLPDSRGVLFTACPGNCSESSAVHGLLLGSDSSKVLVPDAAGAWFAPGGHLLYTNRAGGLFRAGFDPNSLELTSGAVPVIDGVAPATFTFSPSGSALYSVGGESGGEAELVWVTRDGSTEPVDPSWRGQFEYPALSPDGEAIAVSVRARTMDLWVRRSDGTRQKMTQDGTVNWRPFWAPDGRSLIYSSNRGTTGGTTGSAIFRLTMNLSAPELVLRKPAGMAASSGDEGVWEAELSRDTTWIVFRTDDDGGSSNIRARRLHGDTTVVDLAVGAAPELQIALSPDSRWLAYATLVGGRMEVHVSAFPDMSSTRVVSQGDGSEPRWSRDGRELFFKSEGNLVVVSVPAGPVFRPGAPTVLFSVDGFRGARNRQQYDVAPDGQRFLMIRELEANAPGSVIYVENWLEELEARVKQ
jgi:eukaryotic-like serine/threonine-protein kinase